MKKTAFTVLGLTLFLAGCGSSSAPASHFDAADTPEPTETPFILKTSEDKHIAYVNNYVGMNCANVGYTAMDGQRHDYIGEGNLILEFVTEDGSYVGPDDEEALKDYVVTAQNAAPNTEVHLTFETDEDGKEYDTLVSYQDLDEIDLAVKKVGEDGDGPELTEIQQSADYHTAYIRNYVGKNLASVGYESMAGDYRDAYGKGTVALNCVAEDGSYIDYSDRDLLKQYVITSQNIAPNTELTYTFDQDSDGNEYENLIASQSVASITLNVKTLNGEPAVKSTASAASEADAEAALEEAEEKEQDVIGDASKEAESALDEAKNQIGNVIGAVTGIGKSAEDQYQAIYDDYAAKLHQRGPELVTEYNNEAASNTDGISGLADLCSEKIEELAELSNEGVEKMAEVYWAKGSGDYDMYEKYSGDLYDVYMEESEQITNAYMSSVY